MWIPLFLLGSLVAPPLTPGPVLETPEDPVLFALEGGAAWLARHQDDSGRIGAAAAASGAGPCECLSHGQDPGRDEHEVGRTALALVALAQSEDPGRFGATIRGAAGFLLESQTGEDGLIGDRVSWAFLYDHCIATWALARALQLVPEELEGLPAREGLERAVGLLLAARNPSAGWRYDAPPTGASDTSVTTWAVLALAEAREAGIEVPDEPLEHAARLLHRLTDPQTGRIGYSAPGEPSSRETGTNDRHPRETYETMTASGLRALGRLERLEDPVRKLSLELLVARFPAPVEQSDAVLDLYGIHHGAWVLARTTGEKARAHLLEIGAVGAARQELEGCRVGSWSADTVWGHAGGRVYTTALWVLALQEVRAAERQEVEPLFDAEALGALAMEQETLRRQPFAAPERRPRFSGPRSRSSAAGKAAADWLVRHQGPMGDWTDLGFPRRCSPTRGRDICTSAGSSLGSAERSGGVTSLCVLALLGAGADPTGSSDLDAAAAAGLRFLLELDGEARTAPPSRYAGREWLRDRGLPALALTEGYLCCGSPELAEQASWSLEGLLLDRSGPGWGVGLLAAPGQSVSVWVHLTDDEKEANIVSTAVAARALALGASLGLVEFDAELREDIARWAESLIYTDGFQVAYSTGVPKKSSLDSPIGDVRAGCLGWIALATGRLEASRVRPVLERAMEIELEEPDWRTDLDGLGAIAEAAALVRGSQRWTRKLEKWLQDLQEADRKECSRGSWSLGTMSAHSWSGRCYETARCLLILQAGDRQKAYEKVLER
jgi:hypothetical protein